MISIRAATEQDAGAIAHVHVESWRTTYAGIVPDEYLSDLREAERALAWQGWLALGIRVYVAELDDEVVGFISGGAIREPLDGYDAELFAIYLLDRVQGRGLGRSLIKELGVSLAAGGFKSMTAWVLERNPAIHFYERQGAARVGFKEIEIGGVLLEEVAYGWARLEAIALLP